MAKSNQEIQEFMGDSGTLPIHSDDSVAKKLFMLIEGSCLGLGAEKAAAKYGYTKQRYYQLLKDYKEGGTESIKDKKRGPKNNHVRTDVIENQIIRHKFLDPDASSDVISQKLRQTGYKISKRSVGRTITKYGLQKKRFIL